MINNETMGNCIFDLLNLSIFLWLLVGIRLFL